MATGETPEKCPWRCRSARACLGAFRARTRPGLLPGLVSNQSLHESSAATMLEASCAWTDPRSATLSTVASSPDIAVRAYYLQPTD